MITEDYVSFEIAKLLKEHGFDSKCHSHYYPCHLLDGSIEYHKYEYTESKNHSWYDIYTLKNLPKDHYLAPTLQMAMKWLREVHNIFIEISVDEMIEGYQWALYYNDTREIRPFADWGDSYEEACEEAIKYILKNLI